MIGRKIDAAQETLSFVIGEMTQFDRLSIIKFSDDCNILMPMTPMTDEAKLKAKTVVYGKLTCYGCTNIKLGL